MTDAPEIELKILRGDTRPLDLRFKSLVNGDPLDVTGSAFSLRVFDALGTEVLTIDGTITDTGVEFAPTLEQKAGLEPGRSGRWQVDRSIDGNTEVWAMGPLFVTGA